MTRTVWFLWSLALVLAVMLTIMSTMCWYDQKTIAELRYGRECPTYRLQEGQVTTANDTLTVTGLGKFDLINVEGTGSMLPSIGVGVKVIVQVYDGRPLYCGDIIVFPFGGMYVLHRIVFIGEDSDGWYCRTKGDNNEEIDGWKTRKSQIKWLYRGQLN